DGAPVIDPARRAGAAGGCVRGLRGRPARGQKGARRLGRFGFCLLLLGRFTRPRKEIVVDGSEVFRIVVRPGPGGLRLRLPARQPPPAVPNRGPQTKPKNESLHTAPPVAVTREPT